MKMNMNDIDELIIDYLTFNLTDEGAEVLRDWLARSEVNRIYFRKTEGLWYGVHTFGNEPFNKQIAINAISPVSKRMRRKRWQWAIRKRIFLFQQKNGYGLHPLQHCF